MTEVLREQLTPLLDEAQRCFEEIPQLIPYPQAGERVTAFRARFSEVLLKINTIMREDNIRIAKERNVEAPYRSVTTGLSYEYLPDRMCPVHHAFTITLSAMTELATGNLLSQKMRIRAQRNLERRLNARLAEAGVPLFVFVELS
jgi:hypothetical protein